MATEPNNQPGRDIPGDSALPAWRVIVHATLGQDMTAMADALMRAASLTQPDATRVTLEAHARGSAALCVVHAELAEHLVQRLRERGISAAATCVSAPS